MVPIVSPPPDRARSAAATNTAAQPVSAAPLRRNLRGWLQGKLARLLDAPPPAPSNANGELAAEVHDLRALHEATLRVTRTRCWNTALREILAAALAATDTDRGLLSVATSDGRELRLGVSDGFSSEFLQAISKLTVAQGPCGAAFQRRARVIVPDVGEDELFRDLSAIVHLGQFQSCHSVPLIGHSGRAVGVLTVYFSSRHEPDDREVRLLDLYAQMAVDFIERWEADTAVRNAERQHHQMLSSIPIGVYTCDREGRLTFFNHAASELWGRTPELGVERWCGSVRLFLPDGTAVPHEECFMVMAVREGRAWRGAEIVIERPDGSRRHVLPHPEPIYDANGEIVGAINVMVDVTERNGALRAREESEVRWRQLLALLPVGVFACDPPEGRVSFFNRRAEELWGCAPQTGERFAEFVRRFQLSRTDGTEMQPEESPIFAALQEGVSTREMEFFIKRPDGEAVTVSTNVDPIRDAGGRVVSAICAYHDVTARRQSERARQASEARFQQLLSLLPVGVFAIAAPGKFTFCNRRAAELWGFEPPLGEPIREFQRRFTIFWADGSPMRDEDSPVETALRTGEARSNFEVVLGRPDGRRLFLNIHIDVVKDDAGQVTDVICVFHDISERKQAELALRQSEERLRLATETGDVGIWDWDIVADRISWTDSLFEMHGVQRENFDATVRGFSALIHPADRERVQAAVRAAIERDTPYELDFRIQRPDGKLSWVLTSARVFRDNGRAVRMLGATVDITRRKQVEDLLRESEQRFRTLASHAPVGIFLTDVDGHTEFVNESWGRMTGMTIADASGTGWLQAVHPADRDRVDRNWKLAVQDRAVSHEEFRFRRGDGVVTWLEGHAVPLRSATGDFRGYIGTVADITQRREAELALRESQGLLQGSVDALTSHLAVLDVSGNIRSVNAAWREFAQQNFPGSGMREGDNYLAACRSVGGSNGGTNGQRTLMGARDANRATEGIREVMSGALPLFAMEYEFRATGGSRWFVMRVTRFGADENLRLVVAHEEVTSRKLAEDALRKSEEFHRVIAELTSDFAWSARVEGTRVVTESVTEGFTRILGFTLDDLRNGGWEAVRHPAESEDARKTLERLLAGETCEGEMRMRTRAGGERWVRYYTRPLLDGRGRVNRLIGSNVDITERRQTELALRQSEERLRLAAQTGRIGIWDWDLRANRLDWSDVLYDLHGLTPHRLVITPEISRELIHPADRDRVDEAIRRARTEGIPFEIECRCLRADGRTAWLFNHAVVIRDGDQPVRMLGAALDITARKLAEDAVRENEAQLRFVTDAVPVMLMRCNADERFTFANRAYLQQRGVSLDRLVGRTIREVVGPEAYDRLKIFIARVRAGETVRFEMELPYPGIGMRFVSAAYIPERDAAGTVEGFVGSITDVTELKRADATSRQLADIVSSSSDAILGLSLSGVITSWNRGAQVLFGYTEEEMVGEPVARLHLADRHDEGPGLLERIRRGEHIEHFQTMRRRKDGRIAHISLTISPIKDAAGRLVGASKIARDVTDLHLAQEALQQRTRTLEAVNRVSSQLVAQLDLARIVQDVTDAGREVSGAAYGAFFYNPGSDDRASGVPFATSGAPAGEFEKLGLSRETPFVRSMLSGEGVTRVDDFAPEVDNAPAHDGVPIRSYLAAPVVARSGDVLGGLVFAHPDPGVFSAESERIVAAIAAQAAMAIDNAKLYHALERELREKRRAETELRAAQTQLQAHASLLEQRVEERTQSLREAITQMEEFSYTVSHDLRAPLRAMNTYAQALVEDYGQQLDDTARNYLERIQRSSQRMEKLTHDVLTYSRLARSEIKLAPLDLDALLRDMIYQYAEFQPPHAQIKIRRPLLDVQGHEVSLGQCVANLLTNAVKFVAPGVQPRIRIHTERRGEFVRLWIADNGIGIEPHYQARLFEVFERLHGRQQYEGTGIGLAIVRKAIEKMGGRCGVESDGSNGSRFWIELPPALHHET